MKKEFSDFDECEDKISDSAKSGNRCGKGKPKVWCTYPVQRLEGFCALRKTIGKDRPYMSDPIFINSVSQKRVNFSMRRSTGYIERSETSSDDVWIRAPDYLCDDIKNYVELEPGKKYNAKQLIRRCARRTAPCGKDHSYMNRSGVYIMEVSEKKEKGGSYIVYKPNEPDSNVTSVFSEDWDDGNWTSIPDRECHQNKKNH